MNGLKLKHFGVIALALAAIVAVVYVVLRSEWVLERLNSRDAFEEIEI